MPIFRSLLHHQKPQLSLPNSINHSALTSLPKPPLSSLFKEAHETGTDTKPRYHRFRLLQQEGKVKRERLETPKSVYSACKENTQEKEDKEEKRKLGFKELSPELGGFVRHLYKEGYFNEASFFRAGRLDFGRFDDSYGREFIKYASEKFGNDHQGIAMWLSGSDLKKVATFGCPSLSRKDVFHAKRLRNFFDIKEDAVCSKCALKQSCKFVNQRVWNSDTKNLNLAVVLRILTLYALEVVPRELSVPEEIRASVSRLLNEIIRLSETLS